MNPLKRLTYRREVSALAGALHLSGFLRKYYYRWVRPRDGILRFEVCGISGRFHVRNYRELRILDAAEIGERDVLELLIRTVRSGDVVYDIGASVGLYTVLLARAVGEQGQVIAFEPDSESYVHHQDNLKLNGLTNVRCIRKALGEQNGEGRLYVVDGVSCPRLLRLPKSETTCHVRSEAIEMVEGDRFVESEHLPPPRVVKIDVEGYEYAVIHGLRRTLAQPSCRLVCCEIHPHLLPPSEKPEAISALLRTLGFARIETQLRRRDNNFFLIGYKDGFERL